MSGNHVSLQLHFIWSTVRRDPWISRRWKDELYRVLGRIVSDEGGRLLGAGGTADHVHTCVAMPATITIGDLVQLMKLKSSQWVQENYPRKKTISWQQGYGAFSVSKSAEAGVCRFILDQEEHHRMWSFQDEYLSLLRLHQIAYDPESLWY
jgi:REP element-mobilizing transposase RayT